MKKPRVLIVEDDGWLAEQYSNLLNKQGYEVKSVPHAQAAIDEVDNFKPDSIMLDVMLAGGTAFTLLHELQSYKDTVLIPVIICSNLADELSLDKLSPYGVRRILNKATMTPDDLVVALKAVL